MKNTRDIAVIGAGLIGGSILRDLQKRLNPYRLYGVSSDPSALQAKRKRLVKAVLEYDQLPGKVSLIIIASPIETIPDIARKIHRAFATTNEEAIVIDVASVKTTISGVFEKLTNARLEFVATHPMAGTEFAGLDHARLHLFQGKPWIISPHRKNTVKTLEIVESFIRSLGGRIIRLDAERHDTYAAAVSHSTILLSNYIFDFLSTYYSEALDLAGSGFDSTTRLASGNPELHRAIMRNNAETINRIIKEFHRFLEQKTAVEDLAEDYFVLNKQARDTWLHKKTPSSKK